MRLNKLLIPPEEVEDFQTVYQILAHARERYPRRAAYRQIESRTEESEISFSRLGDNVDALRAAMRELGWTGKHIALFGETSVEWISSYLAIVSGVGVCVPIDKELPPETVSTQLGFSDSEIVFCSVKGYRKLSKALPDCPGIKTVVVMRGGVSHDGDEREYLSFTDLIARGEELLKADPEGALPPETDPDRMCAIIFTSGTTGANKGVMLSNRNIMGTLRGCARLLHYPSTSISLLPVNHSYELHAHLMSCIYCGTTVCLNDDLKHLLKNLERFSPEMSCMVPAMLDLIVKRIKKQIEESGRQASFDRAVRLSSALRRVGLDFRKKLFADVLRPLGGKLRMVICGGAALSQGTIDFLDAIGVNVYNGYGITECSPVAAVNPGAKPRKHSVGYVLPTVDARIADPDEEGNGEIQLRGSNVMLGYYKAPEDTKQVFTEDGWFRTGDIGHIDKDGFLYICGRIKNLIILPNGKNIYPEEIEAALMKQIGYIKECVVTAGADETGLYAIIYPDPDFRAEHGSPDAAEFKEFMRADVDAFNSREPGYKRIGDYEITDREFEKNTTHKIQRFKIAR